MAFSFITILTWYGANCFDLTLLLSDITIRLAGSLLISPICTRDIKAGISRTHPLSSTPQLWAYLLQASQGVVRGWDHPGWQSSNDSPNQTDLAPTNIYGHTLTTGSATDFVSLSLLNKALCFQKDYNCLSKWSQKARFHTKGLLEQVIRFILFFFSFIVITKSWK